MSEYHYIVGVALRGNVTFDSPPEFYLKYFYETTGEEWKKLELANILIKNDLWKTTAKESLKISGGSSLNATLYAMFLSAKANDATLHHFITEEKVPEDWFISLPNSTYGRALLKQSKI